MSNMLYLVFIYDGRNPGGGYADLLSVYKTEREATERALAVLGTCKRDGIVAEVVRAADQHRECVANYSTEYETVTVVNKDKILVKRSK